MKFKISDKVIWESQAAGISKIKEGEIICVIPAGEMPDCSMSGFNYGGGTIRDHESYLVKVKSRGIYWPLVRKLRLNK